ncbi:MAG: DNA polymerase IV [Erysipelotrichales bacterium]|nr:DNA polymerase IV [Erysipelotrichales bacterium]
MSKILLHIDMNAYFATCAQIENPKYRNKPLAVGGKSTRSIITTASYEARKYGIKSAMPVFQAKRLYPEIIIVNPDFKIYEKYTRMFVNVIKKYSSKIELVSIDECYVDITKEVQDYKNPLDFIKKIQLDIYDSTGLSCSIGVAPNKFLAKMASDYKKPMGLTIIRKRDIRNILWPIKIESMYGCGKKTSKMLKEEFNILTIGDLANTKNDELKKRLGKSFEVLHTWANGGGDDNVQEEKEDVKSIGNSETLIHNSNDYKEIKDEIVKLVKTIEKRAKKKQLYGSGVAIVIKYADFTVINRSKSVDYPLQDFDEILIIAVKLFEENYEYGRELRLIGVTLISVKPLSEFVRQMSLFDFTQPKQLNSSKCKQLISSINTQLGKNVLKIASDMKGK